MIIRDAIVRGAAVLAKHGVDSSDWNAERLLAFVLKVDRTQFYSDPERVLSAVELSEYDTLLQKRARHFPLAYIEGTQEFYGREFYVNEHVLIPRPETEEIVRAALRLPLPAQSRILDLGAGSGNLVSTLAVEISSAQFVAVELSESAIPVLRKNCDTRVQIVRADMFRAPFLSASFDLVVSNPPYVEADTWHSLPAETLWEPRLALATDSLERTYHSLLKESQRLLRQGGWLIFEIGYDQAGRIEAVCARYPFHLLEKRQDQQGITRTFVLQKP